MKLKKMLKFCKDARRIYFRRYDDKTVYISDGLTMAKLNNDTELTVKSVLEYLEIDAVTAAEFDISDRVTSDVEFDRRIQHSDEKIESLDVSLEINAELCRAFRSIKGLCLIPEQYLDIFTGTKCEYYLRGNNVLLACSDDIIGRVRPLWHDTQGTSELLGALYLSAKTADKNGFFATVHQFAL